MQTRTFSNLRDLVNNLHKGNSSIIDYGNTRVPCISIDQKEFEIIVHSNAGKKSAVDTLLNIFYDGRDVFVDVQLQFLNSKNIKYYLLYANQMLEFFEALAESGMIALVPTDQYHLGSSNIFMVQLPRKDAAYHALDIIKKNAKRTSFNANENDDNLPTDRKHPKDRKIEP